MHGVHTSSVRRIDDASWGDGERALPLALGWRLVHLRNPVVAPALAHLDDVVACVGHDVSANSLWLRGGEQRPTGIGHNCRKGGGGLS